MMPYGLKLQDGGPCLDCGYSHATPTGSRARQQARREIASAILDAEPEPPSLWEWLAEEDGLAEMERDIAENEVADIYWEDE